MDVASLLLLAVGLSLDDFALAFALGLVSPVTTTRGRLAHGGKMAVAFSISTALLPLLGWLIGLAIYGWIVAFSAWVILVVFCGVGAWIIKEAFEDEAPRWKGKDVSSFWTLLVMGTLGSIDEGVVGLGYPFLAIPVAWIIGAVILVNTLMVLVAVLATAWKARMNPRIPPVLSGIILIVLGVLNCIEILWR